MRCSQYSKEGVKKLYCKLHKEVFACCDKELAGKTLKETDFEVEVREDFYADREITKEELIERLNEYANINLLGDKAVTTALEAGIISKESVIEIAGVKHAIILKL